MAKGDYYFPLHYIRLLSSTVGWKDDEFGAYVRLLIHQFDNNNQIPNDINKLTRIAPSAKKNWPLLSEKFSKNDSGNLFNSFMSDVYESVQHKKNIRSEFGKKGGRPKKQNESKTKAKGFENEKQNESHLIINNQNITTEVVIGDAISPEIKNEHWPERLTVERVFIQQGGTKEMAEAFFNKYSAVDWYIRGSPIKEFNFLVPNFIINWNKNNSHKNGSETNTSSVADEIKKARLKHGNH